MDTNDHWVGGWCKFNFCVPNLDKTAHDFLMVTCMLAFPLSSPQVPQFAHMKEPTYFSKWA